MIQPIEIKVTFDGEVIESFWTTTAMDKKEFEGIVRKIPAVKKALKDKEVKVSVFADAVVFLTKE